MKSQLTSIKDFKKKNGTDPINKMIKKSIKAGVGRRESNWTYVPSNGNHNGIWINDNPR